MKNMAYRLKNIKMASLLLAALIFLISCEEESTGKYPDPTINFIVNPDYIISDTTLEVGETFKIGILAESNGHNKLTNFIAKLNNERYLDLGIYKDVYQRELVITKSLEDIEDWEFIIRDINGNSANIYVTIFKDPNITYGEIEEFLNIELGAQNNSSIGSFFSTSSGLVYNLEEAYANQQVIDMLYYYDNFDKLEENIIASPGANITGVYSGQYDVSTWEVKNTTRFIREKLNITTEEFDKAANDSIILAHSFAFESGGRKTKYLEPGDMYSFVNSNTTGIFKVVSTSGTTEGSIVIDIKIQK